MLDVKNKPDIIFITEENLNEKTFTCIVYIDAVACYRNH